MTVSEPKLDLSDLQGNILSPHGRPNVRAIFVKFETEGPGPQKARDLIKELAEKRITSAHKQSEAVARMKKEQGTLPQRSERYMQADGEFVSVLLTARGYHQLGLQELGPTDDLFTKGFPEEWTPAAESAGMTLKHEEWAKADMMVLVACGGPHDGLIESLESEFLDLIMKSAHVVRIDSGTMLFNGAGQTIEPFGYADGLSGPRVVRPDDPPGTSGLPWEELLIHDPAVEEESPDSYGAFMAYEVLKQHVKEFREVGSKENAQCDLERAKLIGRCPDGTPLVAHTGLNDFGYSGDPTGEQCPVSAHIRVANPRDGKHPVRIVRRGIPYGTVKGGDYNQFDPEADQGLLFMAYCQDLQDFKTMQESLRNGRTIDGKAGPADAMMRFVTVRGGEYLFAPSKRGLEKIANSIPAVAASANGSGATAGAPAISSSNGQVKAASAAATPA